MRCCVEDMTVMALAVMLSYCACATRNETAAEARPVPIRDQAPSVTMYLMGQRRSGGVTEVRVRAWLAGEPAMGADWRCAHAEWWIDGHKREKIRPLPHPCDEPLIERRFPRDEAHLFFLGAPSGDVRTDYYQSKVDVVGVTLWNARAQEIASATMEVQR